MKAKVDVANQKVTGTTPNGEQFTMDFEITNCKPRSDINAVLAYQPQGGMEDPDSDDIILTKAVEISPGQVIELEFELPQRMQEQLCNPWRTFCLNWLPEIFNSFEKEVLWEPTTYHIAKANCTIEICYSDNQYEELTPTSVGILSPNKQDGVVTVKHHLYLPETTVEAIILPAGSVIGRVSLEKLARMDEPEMKALMKEVQSQVSDVLLQAEQMRTRLNKEQQDVFSVMMEEGDNAGSSKQTTVRHKAETNLPHHDLRGAKSGEELIKIWEDMMKNNSKIRDQFTSWNNSGIGKLIQYGQKLSKQELRDLQVLCFAFRDIFSENPKAPPEVKGVEHALYFRCNDPKPHRRPIPNLSRQELAHMDKELAAMLANHITQYSDSDWST